jgi:hypothetical protein
MRTEIPIEEHTGLLSHKVVYSKYDFHKVVYSKYDDPSTMLQIK